MREFLRKISFSQFLTPEKHFFDDILDCFIVMNMKNIEKIKCEMSDLTILLI